MNQILSWTETGHIWPDSWRTSDDLSALKKSLDNALDNAINLTDNWDLISEIKSLKDSISLAKSQEELVWLISRLEALKSVEINEVLKSIQRENKTVLNELKQQVVSNTRKPLTRSEIEADYKNIADRWRQASSDNVVSMIKEAKSKWWVLWSIIEKLSNLA